MCTKAIQRVLVSCSSTNAEMMAWLAEEPELAEGSTLSTGCQTAGRGQQGNSWHSKPGANITLSLLLRPKQIAPKEQFALSRLVAVAILLTLRPYLKAYSTNERVWIKWPNDIYFGDRKMAGILIESSLMLNEVEYSVVGIGLNVNEEEAPAELPKFCSLIMISGKEYELDEISQRIVDYCLWLKQRYCRGERAVVEELYKAYLYRAEGWHPFSDADGSFEASIECISPEGELRLRLRDGSQRGYRPKEISFD